MWGTPTPPWTSLGEADVLAGVVVDGGVALEEPADAVLRVGAAVDAVQEVDRQAPGFLGLLRAVAAGHGVVQPAVRHGGEDLDVVALAVPLQGVAEAADVVERHEEVGLAEDAEDGALDARDDGVERLGLVLGDLEVAGLGGAVEDEAGAHVGTGGGRSGRRP